MQNAQGKENNVSQAGGNELRKLERKEGKGSSCNICRYGHKETRFVPTKCLLRDTAMVVLRVGVQRRR